MSSRASMTSAWLHRRILRLRRPRLSQSLRQGKRGNPRRRQYQSSRCKRKAPKRRRKKRQRRKSQRSPRRLTKGQQPRKRRRPLSNLLNSQPWQWEVFSTWTICSAVPQLAVLPVSQGSTLAASQPLNSRWRLPTMTWDSVSGMMLGSRQLTTAATGPMLLAVEMIALVHPSLSTLRHLRPQSS